MQDIYFILSKLPVVIEILFMLSRFVYPRNGKQLLDIERDIYRLTAKIGDQFVLRMLEKVHQDPKFVAKAVQRARSERQVPVKNKGYRLVNVLLLGGSKVVLNTPYFLDNHGLKPGTRKKRRCKSGRGFYPVLEALGIQNGVSPASRSEIALYTIQAASYEEAVKLLKRRDLDVDVSTLKRLAVITSKKDTTLRDAALAAALKIPIRPDGPLANKRVRVSLDCVFQ